MARAGINGAKRRKKQKIRQGLRQQKSMELKEKQTNKRRRCQGLHWMTVDELDCPTPELKKEINDEYYIVQQKELFANRYITNGEVVGRGSFGVVLHAQDIQTGKYVVRQHNVKMMKSLL